LKIFKQRKPALKQKLPEWKRQQKLPESVLRIEEALYRSAQSKKNYCDKVTLEARLLAVARIVFACLGVDDDVMVEEAEQNLVK